MMEDSEINKLRIKDLANTEESLNKDDDHNLNSDFEDSTSFDLVNEMDERSILINITNPEQYLSDKDMIDSIKPGDNAIDIIGVVESISQNSESVHVQKDNRSYTVFNFVLRCQDEIKLPVAMWDDEIQRLKPCILIDHIIHIDAPFARPQKPTKFTYGRDFILTCRTNTIINNLGKMEVDKDSSTLQIFNDINDCMEAFFKKADDRFGLNVYIKTEFRTESQKSNKMIGAVTDLKTKLVVYVCEHDKQIQYKKGTYVQIIGKIVEHNNKFYFEVKNFNEMKKLDGGRQISEKELASIVVTPKRSYINKENENDNNKKMRTD